MTGKLKLVDMKEAIAMAEAKGHNVYDIAKAMLKGQLFPLIRDKKTGKLIRIRVTGVCEKTGEMEYQKFDDGVL